MSETSLESWIQLQPTVRTKREQVLYAIECHVRGATCSEVEMSTGYKHQTVSARIKELLDSGKIFIDRRAYDSETNRNVRVYKAK